MMGGKISEALREMKEEVKKIREGLDAERTQFHDTMIVERKTFEELQRKERRAHQVTERFANKFALMSGTVTLIICAPTMGPVLAAVSGKEAAAAAVISTSFVVAQFSTVLAKAIYPHLPKFFLRVFCCEKEDEVSALELGSDSRLRAQVSPSSQEVKILVEKSSEKNALPSERNELRELRIETNLASPDNKEREGNVGAEVTSSKANDAPTVIFTMSSAKRGSISAGQSNQSLQSNQSGQSTGSGQSNASDKSNVSGTSTGNSSGILGQTSAPSPSKVIVVKEKAKRGKNNARRGGKQ